MYTLLRNVGFRKGLMVEGPSLAASMIVAELFYKFHSFTLECGAFLATWLAVSCLVTLVQNAFISGRASLSRKQFAAESVTPDAQ